MIHFPNNLLQILLYLFRAIKLIKLRLKIHYFMFFLAFLNISVRDKHKRNRKHLPEDIK